ncbi:MAG: serine protease [Negativicutes bacterium]|nr:serine protease [Negativicutes bacterium]
MVQTNSDLLLFATVRIETDESVGTGFFYNRLINGRSYPFIVTNRHVIEESNKGKLFFTRSLGNGKPDIGNIVHFETTNFAQLWFLDDINGIDLAITPLIPITHTIYQKLGHVAKITFIDSDNVITLTTAESLSVLEDIIFVGYPDGRYDKKNYTPIIRRGITATPVKLDYYGEPEFLIDASVYQGSSGSPVLLYNPVMGSARVIGSTILRPGDFLLLGIIARTLAKSSGSGDELIDLGVVIKATKIGELIDQYLLQSDKELIEYHY